MPASVYLLRLPDFDHDESLEDVVLQALEARLANFRLDPPRKVEASDLLDGADAPLCCLIVVIDADLVERYVQHAEATARRLHALFGKLRAIRLNSHIFAAALYHEANGAVDWPKFRTDCGHWTEHSILPIGSRRAHLLSDAARDSFQSFRIGEYRDTNAAGGIARLVREATDLGNQTRRTVLIHGETAALLPPALSDEAAFFAKPIDKRGKANRFGRLVRSIFDGFKQEDKSSEHSAREDTAGDLPVFVVSGETQEALVENLDRLEEAGDKGSLQLIAEDRRPFLLAVRTAAEYRPKATDVADVLKGRQPAILVDPLEDPVPELDEHVFYFVARVPEDVASPARSGNSGFVRGLEGEAP